MQNSKAIKEIRSFNRFYTNVIGVVDQHILNSRYSLTEVRIMFEIYNYPGSTARKIKSFLHVDEGYMSRTIDKLIRLGLIKRKQSDIDKRAFGLSLTKKGEQEFLNLNKLAEAEVGAMIDHLSIEEINEFVLNIRRIQELLNKNK
jgi:DNA-binding MarR family transcriptional regulator